MTGRFEINRLKEVCAACALEGREKLYAHTDEELCRLYNGIGPESFPGWLRAVLDALHPSLAPPRCRTPSRRETLYLPDEDRSARIRMS